MNSIGTITSGVALYIIAALKSRFEKIDQRFDEIERKLGEHTHPAAAGAEAATADPVVPPATNEELPDDIEKALAIRLAAIEREMLERQSQSLEHRLHDHATLVALAKSLVAIMANDDDIDDETLDALQHRFNMIGQKAKVDAGIRRRANIGKAVVAFYLERSPEAPSDPEMYSSLIKQMDDDNVARGKRVFEIPEAIATWITAREEQMKTVVKPLTKAGTPLSLIESHAQLLVMIGSTLEPEAIKQILASQDSFAKRLKP